MNRNNENQSKPVDGQPLAAALDVGMRALRWLAALALILALAAGSILIVRQHEMAFVLRLGEITGAGTERARGPGLYFVLPYPLEETVLIPVQRVQSVVSGTFRHSSGAAPGTSDAPGGYTLTADANILHSDWAVRYRMDNPEQFVFGFVEPETVLRQELDRAVLRASVMFNVDEVLRASGVFSDAVARIFRDRCRVLGLGVALERVDLLGISPPAAARAAFEDVLRAEQEHSSVLHNARQEFNRIVNLAVSDAAQIISDAATARDREIGVISAEADYFKRMLPAYSRNPVLLRRILLQECLQTALPMADAVYLLGRRPSADRELRLLINQPPLKPRGRQTVEENTDVEKK